MAKILAVFGATGRQGSSVINSVLHDPLLSQIYQIRAITRDVNSESAQQLKLKNIDVAQGDAHDRASLETALTDVHTIFAMTNPAFTPNGFEVEFNSAKLIADVAVEKCASYLIFSTLPNVTAITGGKYTHVTHFDAKAKAEEYIRTLPIKSAFVSLGLFMQTFAAMSFMAPQKADDGTWALERHSSPKAEIPMVDAIGDTGKFVGAILAEPDKYEGKTFCASEALYSCEEVASIISKATGKNVVYRQISQEQWESKVPFAKQVLTEAFIYQQEFGNYGPDTEGKIKWAVENARGKLSSFEEYLEAHPLTLSD